MEVRFGRQNSRKSLPTAYFPGVSVSEGVLQRVHEFNDVHCDDMGMARQRVEFGAQKLEWNRTDDGTVVPSFIKPAMMRLITAGDQAASCAAFGLSLNVSRSDCSITVAISRRRSNLSHRA